MYILCIHIHVCTLHVYSLLCSICHVCVCTINILFSLFFQRLSKLEAISQTVSEFDSIKNPLEAWCLSQQEVISSLPLLDTNLEELEKQRQHLEKILHDIETHKDEVDKIDELTDKFSQHREV